MVGSKAETRNPKAEGKPESRNLKGIHMNIEQDPNPVKTPAGGVFRRFFRWLFCWRVASRGLFVLACLATLIGLFYAVENWRGKRAWEKCRRELEAKGEVLDWNAYIPAPVPDDQNIFKAPKIAEWFVKESWAAAVSGGSSKSPLTNAPSTLQPRSHDKRDPVLVAEVDVLPSDAPLPAKKGDAVLRLDDPTARKQVAILLRESIGPCAEGAQRCVIVVRPLDQINPVHLVVQADTVPTAKALAEFLPRRPVPPDDYDSPYPNYFQVAPVGSNAFHVSLQPPVYAAAEYLAQSQPAVPDLDLLRNALERPYARIAGDYQRPFARPIPNFVRLRTVAQMLSQRAQCYLLLGQPEAAWHELTLVRGLCRLLEGSPPGKATTLVEAMIDVAITGLYTSVIEDGLRLRAWREPELVTMQHQLKDLNLLPLLRESMNAERAAACRTFETTPVAEFKKMFFLGEEPRDLWGKLKNPRFLFIGLTPRGWIYQNMCAIALRDQLISELVDVPNGQALPRKTDEIVDQLQTAVGHFTPYTFLGAAVVPNFLKAAQTMARNQTLANEAFVACGLERYRLAHGQYPETLEALVPQFAEKLPHDIIGGQPLKYRRTADSQFVLYSVGWNETDDGGVPGKTIPEGDWVWP